MRVIMSVVVNSKKKQRKEVRDNQQDSEMTFKPREPRHEGMTVNYVGYIDTEAIEDRKITNIARKHGIIGAKVVLFEKLITTGQYAPWHNIPPVVVKLKNGNYKLIAGDHRLQAHRGKGKTKIWVAVVEFDTHKTELIYQSIENRPDLSYVETPRTPADIVNSAKHILISDGYGKDLKSPTDKQLWAVIDELLITTKEAVKADIHELLRESVGTATIDVKGYSSATANQKAAKIHGNSSNHMLVEKYIDTHGVSRDTDKRLLWKILAEKFGCSDPSLLFYVYAYWSRMDGEKIPMARTKKREYWEKLEGQIVDFAKIIQSPDYVSPSLIPLPQLDGEDVE